MYLLHSQINLQVFPEFELTLDIGPLQFVLEVEIDHFDNLISKLLGFGQAILRVKSGNFNNIVPNFHNCHFKIYVEL